MKLTKAEVKAKIKELKAEHRGHVKDAVAAGKVITKAEKARLRLDAQIQKLEATLAA